MHGKSACAGGTKMVKIKSTLSQTSIPSHERIRMAHGRIEMSSAEQLVELRKARDRYKALADRFREEGDALASRFESEGDPLIVMQEKLKHERDARRIVSAYEKSIANIEASSSSMEQARSVGQGARNISTWLAVLAFFLAATALIVGYPGFYRQGLAYLSGVWESPKPTPAPAASNLPGGSTDAALPIVPPPAAAPQTSIAPKPVVAPTKRATPVSEDRGNAPVQAKEGSGDFTAKVLQPDGTLKEQKFSARPRR